MCRIPREPALIFGVSSSWLRVLGPAEHPVGTADSLMRLDSSPSNSERRTHMCRAVPLHVLQAFPRGRPISLARESSGRSPPCRIDDVSGLSGPRQLAYWPCRAQNKTLNQLDRLKTHLRWPPPDPLTVSTLSIADFR